ncbi:MAG: hypothetical protein JNM19_14245 [Chitinophagaceae bacterium]|nr:hypothetical protein [Chitinophagaceae bacterium]
MEDSDRDWKLRLRYGQLVTPYIHYTVIAEGEVNELTDGFECPKGKAFMGMKIWAESQEEAADVFQSIGRQIGFNTTGNLDIYETEPQEPPGENPSGYAITFTPFS